MSKDLTLLLREAGRGDLGARDQLATAVYAELERLARAQLRREHGERMPVAALVDDAFMRLVGEQAGVDWNSRAQFFALASTVMRRVLVEHARARRAQKRGGELTAVDFDESTLAGTITDEEVLAVDEILERLAAVDERWAEIVTMRFLTGMTAQEVADALAISKRTVDREWAAIREWLREALSR